MPAQANSFAVCIMLAAVRHPRQCLPICSDEAVNIKLEAWVRDDHRLHSWVPDWRWSEGIILAEPICPRNAMVTRPHRLRSWREISRAPSARGRDQHNRIVLTAVAWWRLLWQEGADQSSTTIETLWHEICRKGRLNSNDRYLDGETASFAFMQTLSNGCAQVAGHECTAYHEVSDRVWLAKAARYLVESLGTSHDGWYLRRSRPWRRVRRVKGTARNGNAGQLQLQRVGSLRGLRGDTLCSVRRR
jgi:hypothetical protein